MDVSTLGRVFFFFLMQGAACIQGEADFVCYSSSSSEAEHITIVYDKNNDTRNFWDRNDSPLVPCNFSSIYSSSSKCSVCLDDSVGPKRVLVVSCNLTRSVQPVFEGQGRSISFNQTDCPRPEPVRTTEPSITRSVVSKPVSTKKPIERGWTSLYVALACSFILLLLIVGFRYKRYKSQQTPVDESNNVSYDPESGVRLTDMAGNEPAGE